MHLTSWHHMHMVMVTCIPLITMEAAFKPSCKTIQNLGIWYLIVNRRPNSRNSNAILALKAKLLSLISRLPSNVGKAPLYILYSIVYLFFP